VRHLLVSIATFVCLSGSCLSADELPSDADLIRAKAAFDHMARTGEGMPSYCDWMKEEQLFVDMTLGLVPDVTYEKIVAQVDKKKIFREKVWPAYHEALGIWWRAKLAKRNDALMDSVNAAQSGLVEFCVKTQS